MAIAEGFKKIISNYADSWKPIDNFGKFIDLTFTTGAERFTLKTPRKGLKPQIEIKGEMTAECAIANFELKITNFYQDKIIPNVTVLTVSAGYENNMSESVSGIVQSIYTAAPGPDKVTVITCAFANYDSWLEKTIDLKLKEGFLLKDAAAEITNILEFEDAEIDSACASLTCAAPMSVNGTARKAVEELKKAFPDVEFAINRKKIIISPKDAEKSTSVVPVTIPYLIQAAQFSGNAVSLVAPWNPQIKPLDFIKFPVSAAKAVLGLQTFSVAKVSSVSFTFATCTDQNEMVITATAKKVGAAL